MNELEQARIEINEVDYEMAQLFTRRMEAVKRVAAYKQRHGLAISDPSREQAMLDKNAQWIEDAELRGDYIGFLKQTIELSKALQHRLLNGMRVAFGGVEGAFAHIAAQRIFPTAEAKGYSDFKAAYDAVVSGDCDCAVLPLENSLNGDVGQVLDLAFFGALHVNGVYELAVTHNLLAAQSVTLGDLREVVSHPQALGQCAAFIRKHNLTATEAINTAVAAQQVALSPRRDWAAIGSEEAAARYGLVTLAAGINDGGDNTTRFAVFARAAKAPTAADDNFLLMFTVANEAGALSRAVSVIGRHGFNLRTLKSRPTRALRWDYYFFAEGEGSLHTPQGGQMLAELNDVCSSVKVLGIYGSEVRL